MADMGVLVPLLLALFTSSTPGMGRAWKAHATTADGNCMVLEAGTSGLLLFTNPPEEELPSPECMPPSEPICLSN